MALIPRIVEVSRDRTGHAYVLVEFRDRRGGPVVLTEEFVMQIPATRLDPDTQLPVPVDVKAEMRANIRRFVESAEVRNWRGDMTEGPEGVQTRERDRVAGDGILRPLKEEVGAEVDRKLR